jgi:hypothetical protein
MLFSPPSRKKSVRIWLTTTGATVEVSLEGCSNVRALLLRTKEVAAPALDSVLIPQMYLYTRLGTDPLFHLDPLETVIQSPDFPWEGLLPLLVFNRLVCLSLFGKTYEQRERRRC